MKKMYITINKEQLMAIRHLMTIMAGFDSLDLVELQLEIQQILDVDFDELKDDDTEMTYSEAKGIVHDMTMWLKCEPPYDGDANMPHDRDVYSHALHVLSLYEH